MCLCRPSKTQPTLSRWLENVKDSLENEGIEFEHRGVFKNIDPAGDPLIDRREGDGITRAGYMNLKGSTIGGGFEVVDEIEAVRDLGMDIQGYSEINKPWNKENKVEFDMMMDIMFKESNTIYSSSRSDYDIRYLPGGNLLTVNGSITGRVKNRGSDPWGRFCWYTLQGERDEGILVVTAYRVSQESSDEPGPWTAYTQQHIAMREAGIVNPNPRKQVLKDILKLIDEKRTEGFRPLVMMDANGDANFEGDVDKDLVQFIQDAALVDEYHNRYPEQINTYLWGRKRLDYILMDASLVPAVERIGYLGTHEGTISDHVMAYVDFNTKALFRGVINRPAPVHAREFRLHQTDKKKAFQDLLIPKMESNNIKQRVFDLAKLFYKYGRTTENIAMYQSIDQQIIDTAVAVAGQVAKRKYAYMRNPELTKAGRMVILLKMIQDCKARRAPPTEALKRRAESLGVEVSKYYEMTYAEIRKEVTQRRSELWKAQKESEAGRVEWLREEAEKRAKAGDKDKEKVYKDMCRTAEENAVNRKLTSILKPRTGAIDRIQVPTADWYYSRKAKELYHHDQGNFEAHPLAIDELYYEHHTLKVPPPDSVPCIVSREGDKFKLDQVVDWFYSFTTDKLYHVEGKEITSYTHLKDDTYSNPKRSNLPSDAMGALPRSTEKGYYSLVTVLDIPAQMWKDITDPREMEEILCNRNRRHLQQVAIEDGPNNGPIMQDLQKDMGLSESAQQLLDGTYSPQHPVSEEMAAWFRQMKQTPAEKESPEIVGYMTKDQFQECFRKADEKTSSAGPVHYTIWKAMAELDYCAEFMCIMISLPFLYGFVNNRWKNEIDVMLEKKKGIRKVHMLRIIGLLEADFNTALKFFFAVQLQSASEANNSLSDEQWGSRKNRMCIDACMVKLLAFECARIKRGSVAETAYDKKGCFDRMMPPMGNLHKRKQNVSVNICRCTALTLDQMEHRVKSSLGVSRVLYKNAPGQPRIGGEIQGKGDVPTLYLQQSSMLLKAHNELAVGVHLNSCTMRRAIKHNNVSYVDDNDGQVSAPHDSKQPLADSTTRLQKSVSVWNALVADSGHLLTPHKLSWTVLAYEFIKGDAKLVKATDEVIVLEDGKGGFSVIDFRAPDQPNGGLGVKCCPDGNQRHHIKEIRRKLASFCGSVASAHLTEREAYQALIQRLVPMLSYPLNVTSLTEKELAPMNTLIRRAFFPPLKLNRHFPSAVAYGPLEYGGMEFPEAYTLQDQLQIPYFIKSLRMNETVCNDYLTTLDNLQLSSGFVHPIMECTKLPIDYVDKNGWLISLRNRLQELRAGIWIEEAWTPSLQREGDQSLMEVFTQLHGITPRQLEKVNNVRLYLRVITLADLADINGTHIRDDMLNGKWQAGSDLEWPNQSCPPKSWWALFRKCIRGAFCSRTPEHQQAHCSMELDTPLGEWHAVPRSTWWTAYKSHDGIYYRQPGQPETIQKFTFSHNGYHKFEKVVTEIPEASHPINVQEVNDSLWTHKPLRLAPIDEEKEMPPGHVIHNSLQQYNSIIRTASDGSVYTKEQVAAAAWIITSGGTDHISACFLLTDVNAVSAYRSELEGVFRALKHIEYLGLTPSEVRHSADNELSIVRSNEPPTHPKSLMDADADLVLAIQALRQSLPHDIQLKHVYGHQDGAGKAKAAEARKRLEEQYEAQLKAYEEHPYPNSDSSVSTATREVNKMFNPTPKKPEQLPMEEEEDETIQMNIECDRHASGTTKAVLEGGQAPSQPVIQLPYKGSRAMLRIGKKWITSKMKQEIYRAHRKKKIIQYCKERYGWTKEEVKLVNWDTVGTVRRGMKRHSRRFTSKLMHGWLSIMHMRQVITGVNQCPGCSCDDETMTHLFRCPNKEMKKVRKEAIEKMMKMGKTHRIPLHIMEAVCHVAKTEAQGGKDWIKESHTPEVEDAIKQQLRIGTNLMLRGFLAKGWHEAIRRAGSHNPDRKAVALQKIIWEVWAEPIWKARLRILHGPGSRYNIQLDQALAEKVLWFAKHKREVLARCDQFMAKVDVSRLHRMRRQTKQAWCKQLEKVRVAFEEECKTRGKGQNVITDYLVRRDGIT